jgi:hypothetical protein
MRLPGGERAQVDLAKLTDYALNPLHPRGRNKARVFAASLGLTRTDASALQAWLRDVAANVDAAVETAADAHGRRFEISAEMHYLGRTARIRSAWLIRTGEAFPRLVTVFVE